MKFLGIPLGLFFLFLVVATVWNVEPGGTQARLVGSPQAIGQSLFTDYLLPFEATSLLCVNALTINGAAARPLGPAGAAINVQITKDNYKTFLQRL